MCGFEQQIRSVQKKVTVLSFTSSNMSLADWTQMTCFKSRKAAWRVVTVTFWRIWRLCKTSESNMIYHPSPQRSVSIIRENLCLLTPDSRLPDPSVPASHPRSCVSPSFLARWRCPPWSETPGAPWPRAAPRLSPWPLTRTPHHQYENDISFQIDNIWARTFWSAAGRRAKMAAWIIKNCCSSLMSNFPKQQRMTG